MDLINITPMAGRLWDEVWKLYIDSFPEHERRRISSHNLASENPEFFTTIAVENGHLLALLFYWKHEKMIFIEHLAVNPSMRGKNIGSSILRNFVEQHTGSNIILEIEPPEDELTIKRLRFYERIGFKSNNYPYMHPSYCRNGKVHPLVILSYPTSLSQEDFDTFTGYIHTTVLRYID